MKNWLRKAWTAVTNKLGSLAAFITPVARELEVGIAEADKDKILAACDQLDARFHETDETTAAGRELTAHCRKALEDDNLDAIEAAEGLVLIQKLIDEAEDIVTGRDEDDAPDGVATA